MPRNGSGVYSLPAGSTVTNGDTSDATDLNTPLSDIETDMNTVRPVVAGGTGAASASAARTELGIDPIEDLGINARTLVETGGSGNAYTLTAAATVTAYASGQLFLIRPNHTNTGAATLNVDGVGADNIRIREDGGALVAPPAGALRTNYPAMIVRDTAGGGGRFVLLNPYLGREILDDDTFATATADDPASSESIKAYVDNATLGGGNAEWTNETVNRNLGQQYTNSNDYPIKVSVTTRDDAGANRYTVLQSTIAGNVIARQASFTSTGGAVYAHLSHEVPAGATYQFDEVGGLGGVLDLWSEFS